MPPKKKEAAGKKTQEKAKAKVVEDKTFGLKNKKGKKQQTYIKTVQHQVAGSQKKADAGPKLTKRELEKQKLEELNDLFKPVQLAQKVAAGVDPKSVLCSFFKIGTCGKGHKCKFSHDLNIERKSEKRSMYDEGEDEKQEGMESWDQETLEDVVKKKHSASNQNKTDIVCKYFLTAIEKGLYGWFWNCPSNDKCIYRHALPPGFILQKDKKAAEENEDKITLEEHIENERKQLTGDLTPVTLHTFLAWKKRKVQEKKDKYNEEMNRKKEDFKTGRLLSKISGKEMFLFKPEMADNDDDEASDDIALYRREENPEEEEVECKDIDLEQFSMDASSAGVAQHIDTSGISKASSLRASDRDAFEALAPTHKSKKPALEVRTEKTEKLNQATGGTLKTTEDDPSMDGIPVDESLFQDLDDLDIDDLDIDDE